VLAGRSKGRSGKVLSVNAWKGTVTVEHANIIKRHTRANPSKNVKGGILEKEGPIHISNVMLVCPSCGKHTRTGHATLPDGTRVRSCRRCNATFEN
jgi:large subunit ribosomal protein L24